MDYSKNFVVILKEVKIFEFCLWWFDNTYHIGIQFILSVPTSYMISEQFLTFSLKLHIDLENLNNQTEMFSTMFHSIEFQFKLVEIDSSRTLNMGIGINSASSSPG